MKLSDDAIRFIRVSLQLPENETITTAHAKTVLERFERLPSSVAAEEGDQYMSGDRHALLEEITSFSSTKTSLPRLKLVWMDTSESLPPEQLAKEHSSVETPLTKAVGAVLTPLITLVALVVLPLAITFGGPFEALESALKRKRKIRELDNDPTTRALREVAEKVPAEWDEWADRHFLLRKDALLKGEFVDMARLKRPTDGEIRLMSDPEFQHRARIFTNAIWIPYRDLLLARAAELESVDNVFARKKIWNDTFRAWSGIDQPWREVNSVWNRGSTAMQFLHKVFYEDAMMKLAEVERSVPEAERIRVCLERVHRYLTEAGNLAEQDLPNLLEKGLGGSISVELPGEQLKNDIRDLLPDVVKRTPPNFAPSHPLAGIYLKIISELSFKNKAVSADQSSEPLTPEGGIAMRTFPLRPISWFMQLLEAQPFREKTVKILSKEIDPDLAAAYLEKKMRGETPTDKEMQAWQASICFLYLMTGTLTTAPATVYFPWIQPTYRKADSRDFPTVQRHALEMNFFIPEWSDTSKNKFPKESPSKLNVSIYLQNAKKQFNATANDSVGPEELFVDSIGQIDNEAASRALFHHLSDGHETALSEIAEGARVSFGATYGIDPKDVTIHFVFPPHLPMIQGERGAATNRVKSKILPFKKNKLGPQSMHPNRSSVPFRHAKFFGPRGS